MKKPLSLLSATLLVCMFACNNSDNALGILDLNPENNEHLKYFGFTLVDTSWDDPTDSETKTNYIDEVAPFSNVGDILVVSPTDTIVSRMQGMQQLQMKSIPHIAELFFEVEGTDAPSGTDYKLRADYKERWNSFAAVNALSQNTNLIQAFYIGEEPTWNGITATELKMAADYLKAYISEVPILVVEAHSALNDLIVPLSVDWVGFDHYFVKNPQNDASFQNELSILKSKLSDNQNMVFIMDAHYIGNIHGDISGISLNEMGAVANSYYELAKAEPKTVALLGYFWPSGFDDPNAIGARHMPENVKAEYARIGKEITGK